MNKLVVAFDVDDTLIVPSIATGLGRDVPNYDTIAVYRWFQAQGHTMVIWSGSGAEYAKMWGEKLGLRADHYFDKHAQKVAFEMYESEVWPDIAFDDSSYLKLAKVNVQVRRVNNAVIRHAERIEHAKEVRGEK